MVDAGVLGTVRDLPIDREYLRRIVTRLTGIGSTELGFRTTGTPEDAAVADFVMQEMREIGLTEVGAEHVEVDAWRFLGASVTCRSTTDGSEFSCRATSFGGMPPTPPAGVSGGLIDIGDGRRRQLDSCDLRGALVLLDWRWDAVPPWAVALELAGRGVVGVVLNCPAKGPWFQSPDALGGFDSQWPAGAPPMVLVGKEDAAALRQACRHPSPQCTMTLSVTLQTGAGGRNVVGYLTGRRPGPIVIGAHHDAWFRGAFDNTSGVAVMLAMAKALVQSGHRPRHTLCFTSRTAEEYGISGSLYDWCTGAWQQVQVHHPRWATASPFHLCIEASGHPGLRSVIEAPVELRKWARQVGRAAQAQGWTPTGWRVAPEVAGTEQWPFLVSGIPGVAAYSWEKSFARTAYHTQLDTPEVLDFATMEAQTRLYALLALAADLDPNAILDHRARAAQLASIAAACDHADLARSAKAHLKAKGRKAFTRIGTSQFALDADGAGCAPHEQSQRDLGAIIAAVQALDRGDRRLAAAFLQTVGHHHLFRYLGAEAFAAHLARHAPEAVSRSFAAASHLSPVVNLWQPIASLLREPGSKAHGAWLDRALINALKSTRRQLTWRLDSMAKTIDPGLGSTRYVRKARP